MRKSTLTAIFVLALFGGAHSGCAVFHPKTVDYSKSSILKRYSDEQLVSLGMGTLKKYAEVLPCCTLDKKGTRSGDPINIILIAELQELIETFKLAGWDQTEKLGIQTGLHTFQVFLRRRPYRHSPVSNLYIEDKKHDLAFQKIERSINHRNHVRLWYTAMRVGPAPVWIGQVSRDVGVKFTRRWNFLTHRIHPDIDDSRENLFKDLKSVQKVKDYGYVRGVGEASVTTPRENLHNDPYYTDGKRLILVLGSPARS